MLSLAYLARLSQSQLARLINVSERTMRRRLSQDDDSLLRKGWIERIDIGAYDEVGNVPQRRSSLWVLTDTGHAQIRNHPQYPLTALSKDAQYPSRPSLPRKRTVQHDLYVAETVIALIESARERTMGLSGVFTRFEMKLDPNHSAPIADAFVGIHQVAPQERGHPVPWVRDLPTLDERWLNYAVEVDMDTEALQSVIQGKALQYGRMFAEKRWRDNWIQRFAGLPLILWVVPNERRRDAIYRIWREVWPARGYLITTFDDLRKNCWVGHVFGETSTFELFVPLPARRPEAPPALPAPAPRIAAPPTVTPPEPKQLPAAATASEPNQPPVASETREPTEPGAPALPPICEVNLRVRGITEDGKVLSQLDPMTVVIAEDLKKPLQILQYLKDAQPVRFPRPSGDKIQVWVPCTDTKAWLPFSNGWLELDIPWPPPSPHKPQQRPRLPFIIGQYFDVARWKYVWPPRPRRLLLSSATCLIRDWVIVIHALTVLWFRRAEEGTPWIIWWFLAPPLAIAVASYTPMLAIMLTIIYTATLLISLPRWLIWVGATVRRCQNHNPSHPWLRRLALSLPWLTAVLLLLLSWQWLGGMISPAVVSGWF